LEEETQALESIPIPRSPVDLKVLLEAFKSSKGLAPTPQTSLTALNELDEDLRFFSANGDDRLRREIDLATLYPSAHSVLMAR